MVREILKFFQLDIFICYDLHTKKKKTYLSIGHFWPKRDDYISWNSKTGGFYEIKLVDMYGKFGRWKKSIFMLWKTKKLTIQRDECCIQQLKIKFENDKKEIIDKYSNYKIIIRYTLSSNTENINNFKKHLEDVHYNYRCTSYRYNEIELEITQK